MADLLAVLVGVTCVLAVLIIGHAPQLAASWLYDQRAKALERLRKQALLERKDEIYDQLVAARARGEKPVPPPDWNAS